MLKYTLEQLQADEVRNIHELNFVPFNTNGSPDTSVPSSNSDDDFREYKYSVAGLNAFTQRFKLRFV